MAELLVGIAIVVGLVGVVVPILPGLLLVSAAIGIWSFSSQSWWLLVAVALITTVALTLKVAIPARTARDSASTAAVVVGALAALAGFFVIPVVGMIVGFLAGVLLTELARLRDLGQAWQATAAATKSIGITIAVELVAVIVMSGLWTVALLAA